MKRTKPLSVRDLDTIYEEADYILDDKEEIPGSLGYIE